MRSFIALSFLAAAVAVDAQSSSASSAAPSSTASPLIPTGISSGCSSFLQSLNTNTSLASCIAPVVNATLAFSPLSNTTANATSSAAVNSALSTLCATSSLSAGCNDAVIRGLLSSMLSACSNELMTSPNQDVVRIYDVLYTIIPLKDAICTKDDSGKYCVTQASGTSQSDSTPSVSASVSVGGSKSFVASTKQSMYDLVENNLWSFISSPLRKRGPDDDTTAAVAALIPNTTTFRTSNLPFLFLSPNTDSTVLCTTCTRSVLSAYITFEQTVPYALGIANSPMLGGQTDLYNHVVGECGSGFMSGAVQAAGGLSGGLVSAAEPLLSWNKESGAFSAAAAVVLGFVALL